MPMFIQVLYIYLFIFMFIFIIGSTYIFCKPFKHAILHKTSIIIFIYQRVNSKTSGVHPNYTDLDPDDDLVIPGSVPPPHPTPENGRSRAVG